MKLSGIVITFAFICMLSCNSQGEMRFYAKEYKAGRLFQRLGNKPAAEGGFSMLRSIFLSDVNQNIDEVDIIEKTFKSDEVDKNVL